MEDVTDKVLQEMKEINNNYDNAILDASKKWKQIPKIHLCLELNGVFGLL